MIEGKFIVEQVIKARKYQNGSAGKTTKDVEFQIATGRARISIHTPSDELAQKLSDAIHAVLEGK